MCGSLAFMVRDKLCISVRAERIMCRIDPALHAAALEHAGCQTVVMKGRPYRGYVYASMTSGESALRGKVRTLSMWRLWMITEVRK
ncbi:MAG: hypothetical protein IAE81_24925 [Caldilineaceae bacterium]|nr:hypothetical protein [Caldilineaceae bacterium]